MIRIGTAGWSFPDWEGIVYPSGKAGARAALGVLSGLFDTLEINSSFYRPPAPRISEGWARRVESSPAFMFTAKLWQGFTHDRGQEHRDEEAACKEGFRPLQRAGRLGTVLAQFPHSFHHSASGAGYLERLLDRFSEFPLAVELRHDSWLTDAAMKMLELRQVAFCNLDQPQIGATVPPTTIVTAPTAYVRMHGRNGEAWFDKEADRDSRYDYLYSLDEIGQWAERVRLMQGRTKEIFIIANNHYRGQAVANALELAHALTGVQRVIPPGLLAAFPRLASVASGSTPPDRAQGRLPL